MAIIVSLDDVHPDELGNADLNPEQILSNLEQSLLEEYSLNLKGITVNTTNPVLTAEQAGKLVHTRYTDLLDVIEDVITDVEFKARVLPSMAWMIDSTMLTTARVWLLSEFRNMRSADDYTPTEGADELDVFLRTFAGALEVEAVFGTGGSASTLAQLCRLRQDWHDAASCAMNAAGRIYDPRSLEAMIAAEKVQELKPEAKGRQVQLIKVMAEMGGDEVYIDEMLLKMFESRNASRAASRLALNKRMGPAVLNVVDIATRYAPGRVEFTELDKMIRERFIRVSQKFAMNAVSDLSERSGMSDFEYGMVLIEFKKFKLQTELILKTQYKDDPHPSQLSASRNEKSAQRHTDAADASDKKLIKSGVATTPELPTTVRSREEEIALTHARGGDDAVRAGFGEEALAQFLNA